MYCISSVRLCSQILVKKGSKLSGFLPSELFTMLLVSEIKSWNLLRIMSVEVFFVIVLLIWLHQYKRVLHQYNLVSFWPLLFLSSDVLRDVFPQTRFSVVMLKFIIFFYSRSFLARLALNLRNVKSLAAFDLLMRVITTRYTKCYFKSVIDSIMVLFVLKFS